MARLRLALVQYDAKLGQVQTNIARVDALIANILPNSIDVLLLPEMAFTGYVFDSRDDIAPFLEMDGRGPSVTWARRTAERLRCYVLVGFPESQRAADSDRDDRESASQPGIGDSVGNAFNALAVVNWQGHLQTVYRKHFLFDTDKKWANPGSSFEMIQLTLPDQRGKLRVAPAICMDLNPKDFIAAFTSFEFATFAKAQQAHLVLCAMNWLATEPPLECGGSSAAEQDDWKQLSEVLSYWAARLNPLRGSKAVFAGCNRIGRERGIAFTGASCVMRLDETVSVVAYAGLQAETVLLTSVDV